MAQVANTFETYDAVGLREELDDVIYNISPIETPFMNSIGKGSCDSKHPEWQTDALAAVDLNNDHIEGDDVASFGALTPTVRVGNYTQISRKVFLISGTEEVVDKAGRGSEYDYQKMKKGNELKRDIEAMACQNRASLAGSGNGATNRKAGSFEAWITTNGSRGAGAGADGGFNAGTGIVDIAVDGDLRTFTEEMFQQAAQDAWNSGGNPTLVICGGAHKRAISKFANANAGGTATVTRMDNNEDRTLTTAIDVYRHDFGVLRVIPSRFCRTRTILVIDPTMWEMLWLRPFFSKNLADTGDSLKCMLLGEWTLKSKNQAASATIADLT